MTQEKYGFSWDVSDDISDVFLQKITSNSSPHILDLA